MHPGTVFGVEHENIRTPARKSFLVAKIEEIEETFANNIVESLSALPTYPVVCKSFFNFRDFLHPGTVFGGEHEFTGTRLENVFSSRGARKKFSIALLKMKYVKTSKL